MRHSKGYPGNVPNKESWQVTLDALGSAANGYTQNHMVPENG